MRTRNIVLLIVLLVIIDQAAKLIIYHSFMGDRNLNSVQKQFTLHYG